MLRYLKNVVTLHLDENTCTGCGMCAIVCPHGVFTLDDHKASIADIDACMECGACARNCPVNAIGVRAGVGCATGAIFAAIGINSDCCCSGTPLDGPCCPPQGELISIGDLTRAAETEDPRKAG